MYVMAKFLDYKGKIILMKASFYLRLKSIILRFMKFGLFITSESAFDFL